jgi:hypothetical protein
VRSAGVCAKEAVCTESKAQAVRASEAPQTLPALRQPSRAPPYSALSPNTPHLPRPVSLGGIQKKKWQLNGAKSIGSEQAVANEDAHEDAHEDADTTVERTSGLGVEAVARDVPCQLGCDWRVSAPAFNAQD